MEAFGRCNVEGVERAFEVGVGTGFLTKLLTAQYPCAQWYLNDITPHSGEYVEQYLDKVEHSYIWGDAESLEFPKGLNLVATASTVQWFDKLPKFIERANEAILEGGWLLLSTFGEDNYHEVKTASGKGLSYYSLGEVEQIVEQGGFRVVWGEEYRDVLEFDNPIEVLHHIRATGVNSIKQTHWSRGKLEQFCDSYKRECSTAEGLVTLTYHPLILVAQKK